jgi:hypothetical protein
MTQKTLADRKGRTRVARRRSWASLGNFSLSVDALGKYDAGQRYHVADVNRWLSKVSTLRDGDSEYWTLRLSGSPAFHGIGHAVHHL